jgi:hypothetical protein
MKQYYIVWNADRTEGCITDDADDALAVARDGGTCSAGLAFWEIYGEDGPLEIQGLQL